MESELDIREIFWDSLTAGDSTDVRSVSEEQLKILHHHGLADVRRVPLQRWLAAFEHFPKNQDQYIINRDSAKSIESLLYKGPIKKPFDPESLKEGPRPAEWLNELYKKVLRFETVLQEQEWRNLVQNKIRQRYFQKDQFIISQESKEFLEAVIEHKSSALRRLELWVHEGPPSLVPAKKPEKNIQSSSKQVIRDSFEPKSKEIMAMKKIEKLYYVPTSSAPPPVNDEETLDILDELAEMPEEEDPELP
jgi:hypothetical protein